MKTTRRRDVGSNVAITLRVMSLRRSTYERCQERLIPYADRLVTRERDGGVGRAGTTLTEVVMSLLIMSIGIVSVATLFPIATLRTLEANKQTNSTISRFVSESLIDVDPSFVHNPDGYYPPGGAGDLTPYNGTSFRGLNYMVDPLGFQNLNEDNPQPFSPPLAPWQPPGNPTYRDYFGNFGGSTPPGWITAALPRRYTGATFFPYIAGEVSPYPSGAAEISGAIARASQLVSQPDNWKLVSVGQATGTGTPTSILAVSLENDADLSSVNISTAMYPKVVYRAIVFDADGTHSEVRPLTSVTTNPATLTWSDPLPTRFEGGNIGKVRVETAEDIYTWMLSVRKRPSGSTNVDVVVFFKRGLSDPQHEMIWPAKFVRYQLGPGPITTISGGAGGLPGVDGVDDNGINGADDIAEIGYPNSNDVANGYVPIDFTTIPTGFKAPVLKRGGYAYDTKNGLWYRVRAIQYETATSAVLVLDESVKQDNTEDRNLNGVLDPGEDVNLNGVIDQGGVILHPHVVNVFPLEIKEP